MKATQVFHDRAIFDDGSMIEMTLWRVPAPVSGSEHTYKYSLFYGKPGQRLVGYDNERGKGDHRHLGNKEVAYQFSTVEKLIADFLADVRHERGGS